MNEAEKRKILSDVALGSIPPDIVIRNSTVFNVFTGEFIKGQSVLIKGGMIAYVGPDHDPSIAEDTLAIDAKGMVVLPGLIDGHTHAITNKVGIEEFVKHVIPSGVTTVVTETIEYATVAGKDGIEYVARGLEGQPIRVYYTVPPLCGLTLSEEEKAPTNEELLPLLKDPKCVGVGEIYWANIFLEGRQGARVQELASLSLGLGKIVEGHGAGAKGRKLQAYSCFGISSCHESVTADEILERLRLGYSVMIREGSVRKELEGVKDIFTQKIDFRRLCLTTDGVDPEESLQEGYLEAALRRLLKLGISPSLAYQMVTINVAEHFRLDHVIGSLSPGKWADLVMIPSPDEFVPQMVMCDGKIIYRDGRSMAEPKKVFFPASMFNTVKIPDYIFPPLPHRGKVRAMELITRLVTQERIIDLENPGDSEDLLMLFSLDRLGRGRTFMGLLKGFGLRRGAYGSTMCWDVMDMVVAGCDARSMETVIRRLGEIGGGGVYAIGDEIVTEFAAPLCGIASLASMEAVRDDLRHIEESLRSYGVEWEKPILTFDTLTTPAIPHLRISHQGYVRLKDRKILPLEI